MVRALAEREFAPRAREWDREHTFLSDEELRKLADLGLLGMCFPPEYGGAGAPAFDAILAIEELARVSSVCAFPVFESNVGPIRVVEHFGTEAQKRKYLPAVAAGQHWMAVAITEPHAGSAATDMRTKAVRQGERYVLNGGKVFVSGGGVADSYLVYCRLSDEPGSRAIGALVVEKGTPGLSFGKQERHMGMHGIPAAELVFDNAEVPAENLVVPAGHFRDLMRGFDLERCGNATMALGIAQAALDAALAYSQERQQFGRPICEFQAIQLMLADMAMKVDAARLLIYRAVTNAAQGLPSALESSMAKTFSVETATQVTDLALQIFGGYGYSEEGPVERLVRDARGWQIAGGTVQMQRITIASELLHRRFNQRPTGG
jgi:butyryl-CoA dehydrogenase